MLHEFCLSIPYEESETVGFHTLVSDRAIAEAHKRGYSLEGRKFRDCGVYGDSLSNAAFMLQTMNCMAAKLLRDENTELACFYIVEHRCVYVIGVK